MMTGDRGRWVLLAYRIPREPSTPRISVWRKLRRLGAAQLLDGLVALPLDSRNREQMEWLADEVQDAGGEAQIWIAEPATAAQERALASGMARSIAEEYEALAAAAGAAADEEPAVRRRTLAKLRRDMRNIRARDYFPGPARQTARAALEQLSGSTEVRH
ncbi:MAG: Chromate resistance protein ChrB [Dehalococcoidia bacterium]